MIAALRLVRTGTALFLLGVACLYLLLVGVLILWGLVSLASWVMGLLGRVFT